jgi:hypothetical protein
MKAIGIYVFGSALLTSCALGAGAPIGLTEQPLNASPSVTSTTALASGHARSFGGMCVVRDTTNNREVFIAAFGYRGNPENYVNDYDVYDDAAMTKWISSGTVSGGGNTAAAVAYVATSRHPSVDSKCYFGGGYTGASLSKQLWMVTVAGGTATFVKQTDMNVARAKFALTTCGTNTRKLMAVGGGFGATATDTIETFDLTSTWATATAKLSDTLYGFGFVKLSDLEFAQANGHGGATDPSPDLNALKVDTDCANLSVGQLTSRTTARAYNALMPTGRTTANSSPALGGTKRIELLDVSGDNGANTLVTAADTVVVEYGNTPPTFVSSSTGTAPSNVTFATFVDASSALTNPGYYLLEGMTAAATAAPVNAVQKWNPSSTGGSWATSATLGQSRLGVNGAYSKGLDKLLVCSGSNQYPATTGQTDYTQADLVQ